MNKRENAKRAPTAEIVKGLNEGIANTDVMRADGLDGLNDALNAKTNQYKREYQRLSKKLGDKHPRVLALSEKIELHVEFSEVVGSNVIRARIETPTPEEKSWILHGRVMDTEEKGLPGLIVSLVDARNKPIATASTGTTDKEGIFKLKVTGEKAATGKEKGYATNIREGVFIAVSDKQQTLLKIDDQLFIPTPDVVGYREIIIEEDLSLCASDKIRRGNPEETKQPPLKSTEKSPTQPKAARAAPVAKRASKPTKPTKPK